ncbi:MAG: M12 family metallo-peptidase [Candidatus Poribacteria bacterium]|nr:M12 family metallo-peptidase [Candidatus Poribacteria bacterium]
MRSKKLLPFYVLITLLVSGLIGLYIFWKIDPSNQKFAQPPEKLTPIAEFNHEARIYDVAFSPVDASLVAGADDNNTIKLWHFANTVAPQAILRGHIGPVKSIAFSPDGKLLASAGFFYSRVILWDVLSATKINSLETPAIAVAISSDGYYLATAGRHLKLWDIRNPKEIAEVETFPHDKSVLLWTVNFSPDGKWLACGDENGRLKVWDIQHKKLVRSVKANSDEIRSVRFSADGRFLASTGLYSHTLWRLPEWQLHGKIIGEGIGVDVDFSPDGKMYSTPNLRGVILRSATSGARIVSLESTTGAIRSIDFSPNGNMLASGGKDETLRLWNVSAQQLTRIDTTQHDVVRLIYFLSKERPPQRSIIVKLDRLIRQAQRFYAIQMKSHGFERKTFTFETDAHRKAKVYLLKAQRPDDYYHEDTIKKIRTEVTKHFDRSKNILLIAVDIKSGIFFGKDSTTSGVGGVTPFTYDNELNRSLHGGSAFVSASHNDLEWDTIAHELGHAFGLQHDFRGRNRSIMSYASGRYELSKCAAEWLDKNRFFNPNQPFFDKRATIEMLSLSNASDAPTLQFEVTDEDGLHQVQLIVPTTRRDPVTKQGFKLHSCQSLNGAEKATVTFELPKTSVKEIELWMMDLHGNIVWREFDLSKDSAQLSEEP